jgi:hypothetical protein
METSSDKRLRADLEEARDALETVSGSLRFQIGDALVSALSGGGTPASRARALISAVRRARSLLAYSRIRRKIFSGLPHDGLPKFPASISLEELRALEKYVSARVGSRNGIKHAGPGPTSHWSASLIALVGEFRQAIDSGYAFEIAKQPNRLSAADQKRIVYVTQHDPEKSVNGYARRTREIVRGLEADGFSVMLVTPPKAGIAGGGNGLRAHVDAPHTLRFQLLERPCGDYHRPLNGHPLCL